ncbi:MAG: hypothetical protein ACLQVM_17730 [Terriglobia bacterium]
MTILYGKSSFYRTSILLWLSVSLAGQMLGPLRITAQTAAPMPTQPGAGETRRETAGKITSQLESDAQTGPGPSQSSASGRQKRELLKANLEKMKRDAGELADLVKALQEDLNKSNENMLPLGVVEKADSIQKVAKRIKGAARGF